MRLLRLWPFIRPTVRLILDSCSSGLSSLRFCSVVARVGTRRLLELTLLLLPSLLVGMLLLEAVSRPPLPVLSSNSTLVPGKILLLSYETQCVSSAADPSTTTTTSPTGSLPLPCDLLGAQAAQDHTFLAVVGLALIGFLLSLLVGLRLWS